MNRIVLADSNPTLRSALALLLETRLDVQIIGQVSSMESLLSEIVTCPDMIVMDWDLPGEPAEERVAALRQRASHVRILVISSGPENINLKGAADAFVCKTDSPETILQVIQAIITDIEKEKAKRIDSRGQVDL